MNSKIKLKLKLIIDILMTFALLLLMSYELLGSTAHEVVGVVMFVLFVVHHALNINWAKHLAKGRQTPIRIFAKYSCFACAYIICRLNRQRGNCFKASVYIFEYKINLCSEQNPYAFCILGIYIYVAPPRTSFQYDFANDKKEKATLTKSEDCFQNNIHTHFCIRNLRIFQSGYSILPVPEKSVFLPWR